jgi:glycosyltransferase involved in cell wall biosynthesis
MCRRRTGLVDVGGIAIRWVVCRLAPRVGPCLTTANPEQTNLEPSDPFAVDVVIPVRDGARYLRPCLDSVMAQTRPVRAAIAVDDGSTDATPDILADYRRRWPALQVVRTDKRGVSHARNIAIARCDAPFIAFLDSDDVWAGNKLERQLDLFAKQGARVGLVYCGYSLVDERGRPSDGIVIAPRLRGDVLADLLLGGNLISGSGSAVVARRSLLERAGRFDESLSFGEDWDVWLRLAELSEVDFVPEPLVAIRLHTASAQNRHKLKLQLLQHVRVLDRWYVQGKAPPTLRAQFRKDVVSIAIDGIRREPLAGWLHAWRLVTDLRRSDSSFGKDLFSGRADFLREFPYRAAAAMRRRIGRVHP